MQWIGRVIVLFLTMFIFGHAAFSQEIFEMPYMETENEDGETVIQKRDFAAEEKIKIEPLAGCITLHSSASGGYLTGGSSSVVFSYTTGCSGYHTTSGLTKTPYNAYIRTRLQKRSGSSWITVKSGYGYSYSGTAGQYRIIIDNLGSVTATSWSFNYSLPL